MENDVYAGMKHGHLTVIRPLGKKDGHPLFECECECGATVVLRKSHFYPTRMYCSRSCPLLLPSRHPDLAGRKFGRWTVLAKLESREHAGKRRLFWKCRCDCGEEREFQGDLLTSGGSQSCGCLAIDTNTVHHTLEAKQEAHRAACRKTNRKNPARVKAAKIKWENSLSRATPQWLTVDQWKEMNKIYRQAQYRTAKTGTRHEVDHVVPINGELVSGLHVPWNLQVLTQVENVRKSNRYADLGGDIEN